MLSKTKLSALMCLASCLLNPRATCADVVIGPGNITVQANGGRENTDVVDLNDPMTLAAGTYTASSFNYAFLAAGVGNIPLGGGVEPMLLTAGGLDSFNVVTLGAVADYNGTSSFASHAFGGSTSFTLASSTTVYAGFYWSVDSGLQQALTLNVMPLGYAEDGSSFVVENTYSAPSLGGLIDESSGESAQDYAETYDFSVTVAVPVIVTVPEPSTFVLAAVAAATCLIVGMRHRMRCCSAA